MVNTDDTVTTVAIRKDTRKKLAAITHKDQTFDAIIAELIKSWHERQ